MNVDALGDYLSESSVWVRCLLLPPHLPARDRIGQRTERIAKRMSRYAAHPREGDEKVRVCRYMPMRYKEGTMIESRRNHVNRAKNVCNHTENQWRAVVSATGGVCLKCRRPMHVTRDHVKPVSMGGDHGIYNIQPLCYECNTIKNARHIDYRSSNDMVAIMQALYLSDCCGMIYPKQATTCKVFSDALQQ